MTNISEKGERNKKKVSTILVSQPKPVDKDSQYFKLAEKYNLKIDFRSFIEIQPVNLAEFRAQKVDILSHTAVIFTSRHAVDHFFTLSREMKIDIPTDMKYFCVSELTANYVQKYIVVRKRKMFSGTRTTNDLIEILKKHKDEKFLLPCSNIGAKDIPNFLSTNGNQFTEAIFYKTVASDLSDLAEVNYDVIAFFSPADINSLFLNFPDFKQNYTRIAGFGPSTSKAISDHGLVINIEAPRPEAPSMVGAIELYIKGVMAEMK